MFALTYVTKTRDDREVSLASFLSFSGVEVVLLVLLLDQVLRADDSLFEE